MRRRSLALALAVAALTACSGEQGPAPVPSQSTSHAPGRTMVELGYQVPDGFVLVTGPARSPQPGMTYDIKVFEQDASGCALQVMRVLMGTSNGMEDQDVTYNMVSGMATAQGVADADKVTEGLFFPGEPGPVPGLSLAGGTDTKDVRIAGRLSNESLQGFSAMLLCPRGKGSDQTWTKFLAQLRVDGFQGSLEEH